MSTLFASLLVLHIMSGLTGTILTYATLLIVLKKEVVRKKFFITSSLAWLSYVVTWFSGGYYYWFYYGAQVKPIIKAGQYPWAHSIVMEAKEHIFLLLPVLSLVIALIAWSSTDSINADSRLKSAVVYLIAVTCTIAVLVALSGIIISGGAQ